MPEAPQRSWDQDEDQTLISKDAFRTCCDLFQEQLLDKDAESLFNCQFLVTCQPFFQLEKLPPPFSRSENWKGAREESSADSLDSLYGLDLLWGARL